PPLPPSPRHTPPWQVEMSTNSPGQPRWIGSPDWGLKFYAILDLSSAPARWANCIDSLSKLTQLRDSLALRHFRAGEGTQTPRGPDTSRFPRLQPIRCPRK
ncbi:hypothetical protein VN97_g11933, partial [Penicillium thymicola]